MKIIPLPEADSDLLKAAKAACAEAELALGRANKACQVAQDNYDELLKQTRLKHGLELGQASDDQIYLFGNPLKQAEPEPLAEVVELPPEPEPEVLPDDEPPPEPEPEPEPELPVEEPPLEEPPPPLEEPPLEDPGISEGVPV